MAQGRYTGRFSLTLLWQQVVGSYCLPACRVKIDTDVRFASALETRKILEVERAEALEQSDRLDRFHQALCRERGFR
jgi:hypothetical protein